METANISKVLRLFSKLSKPEQLDLVEKIEKLTFKDRRKLMNNFRRDVTDDNGVREIRTLRYSSERFGLL